MELIREPGIYDMPDKDYHADPAIEPSLSRSVLKLLVDRSPLHAKAAHPRLSGTGAGGSDPSDEMDTGSAAHTLFLQGSDAVELIPFDTYQSKDAKALRAAARAAGRVPIKRNKMPAVEGIVAALERFRKDTGLFTAGKPEQTLIWREGWRYARARVDWMPDDPGGFLVDLKTTDGAALERTWSRAAFENGADVQHAWYCRGSEAVHGLPPAGMLFVVVEANPPHGIRVFRLGFQGLEMGEARVEAGIQLWDRCMASGQWPDYGREIAEVSPPPWILNDWLAQSDRVTGSVDMAERFIASGQFGG